MKIEKIKNKNRRGDVPITILVIGVLIICIVAIFSFYFSERGVKKSLAGNSLVEEASILKEKISFYGELGFSDDKIKTLFDIKEDAFGKYLFLEKGPVSIVYYLGE